MPTTLRGSSAAALRTVDGLVLFWVVLWAVLGALTGITVWRSADTGDTISRSGRALNSVGNGLQELSDLPVIPAEPGRIGRQVSANGVEVTARGQDIKRQLHELAVLLGVIIVLVPMTPVLGLYAPLRVSRAREVRQLRRLLTLRPEDPGLERYLADHARQRLAYAEIARLVDTSKPDFTPGELRRLADAELRRLGLNRG